MTMIYLDHAATTPMHPAVVEAMVPAMLQLYGNASSIHQLGREARKALDAARHTLAASIGAQDNEIILTSGGTEADNLAIFGVAYAQQHKGKHIITTAIEHHAVLHSCQQLEKEGFEVSYLPVDEQGHVALKDVKNALREDTILVTIMYGNNEVGSIQPIAEIGALLQNHQAVFHSDAVQAYGLVAMHVDELKVDLLSVSAHKINGPKGIGFLYQRSGTPLAVYAHGGQQERKRRAGTENVPAVIGFAKAVALAQQHLQEKQQSYTNFAQIMQDVWQQQGIDCKVNGDVQSRLPHVFNVSFVGANIESLLVNLDMAGIYASSGSACTAGAIDPSHVLVAMFGKDAEELRSSVRFSFGYGLDEQQITAAANEVATIIKRLVK